MSAAEQHQDDRLWVRDLTADDLLAIPVGEARTYYFRDMLPVTVMHWLPARFKWFGVTIDIVTRIDSLPASTLVYLLYSSDRLR